MLEIHEMFTHDSFSAGGKIEVSGGEEMLNRPTELLMILYMAASMYKH